MRDLIRLPPAAAIDTADARSRPRRARRREPAAVPARSDCAPPARVPDASTVVVERVRDELGDWRVCVLSPRGGRIHAPWAMAAAAKIREETGVDVETIWGDDGFVVRFPDVDQPPDPRLVLPDPDEVQVAGRAAARRDGALRGEVPRERGALAAAAEAPSRDARAALAAAQARRRPAGGRVALRIVSGAARDLSRVPARFLRHAGAGLDAHRRPQPHDPRRHRRFRSAVAVCRVTALQLRRELSLRRRRAARRTPGAGAGRRPGAAARAASATPSCASCWTATRWTRSSGSCSVSIDNYHARNADGVHDMLLSLGDLDARGSRRAHRQPGGRAVDSRARPGAARRSSCAWPAPSASSPSRTPRAIATRSACRCRRACPDALLDTGPRSARRSRAALSRARTRRSPRPTSPPATGWRSAEAEAVLMRLTGESRLLEGEFRPGGTRREWTDPNVLRQLRRRSLAKLRREVEPVDQPVLGRFVSTWQGSRPEAARHRRPARRHRTAAGRAAAGVDSRDRDSAGASRALRPGGSRRGDGRRRGGVGRRRAARRSRRPRRAVPRRSSRRICCRRCGTPIRRPDDAVARGRARLAGRARRVVLRRRSTKAAGGGYPGETVDALWKSGLAGLRHQRHDARPPRRSRARGRRAVAARRHDAGTFRSRRLAPPTAEGRWSAGRAVDPPMPAPPRREQRGRTHRWLAGHRAAAADAPRRADARGGVGRVACRAASARSTRCSRRWRKTDESAAATSSPASAPRSSPLPGALDLLRSLRDGSRRRRRRRGRRARRHRSGQSVRRDARSGRPRPAATPAAAPTRTVGATVMLVDGALVAFLARGDRLLLTWLPEAEPERSRAARAHRRPRSSSAPGPAATAPRGMLHRGDRRRRPPSGARARAVPGRRPASSAARMG